MDYSNRKLVKTKLKAVRLDRGLTQAQVAVAAGFNTQAYSNLEQGIKDISKTSIYRILCICKTLKCEISEIVDDGATLEMYAAYRSMLLESIIASNSSNNTSGSNASSGNPS